MSQSGRLNWSGEGGEVCGAVCQVMGKEAFSTEKRARDVVVETIISIFEPLLYVQVLCLPFYTRDFV